MGLRATSPIAVDPTIRAIRDLTQDVEDAEAGFADKPNDVTAALIQARRRARQLAIRDVRRTFKIVE